MSNWFKGNRYLPYAEMEHNACLVFLYLQHKGWTANAIAGVLGNMESESTINPGIWQSLDDTNTSGGFGLVQWTPSTNFTDWAISNGYEIDDGYAQLKWINEQTTTFGQWIPTSEYNISFGEFKRSTETPENLASAFLKNFERAGVEVEESRRSQARTWYDLLTNYNFSDDAPVGPDEPYDPDNPGEIPDTPVTPSPTPTTTKRRRYNFILFNAQKRRRQLI